jgi:hypothetical protein
LQGRIFELLKTQGAGQENSEGGPFSPEEVEIILKGKYLPLNIRAQQAARDIQKSGLRVRIIMEGPEFPRALLLKRIPSQA